MENEINEGDDQETEKELTNFAKTTRSTMNNGLQRTIFCLLNKVTIL